MPRDPEVPLGPCEYSLSDGRSSETCHTRLPFSLVPTTVYIEYKFLFNFTCVLVDASGSGSSIGRKTTIRCLSRIQATQCLVLAEINGCQVRDWIVGKLNSRMSQLAYKTCVNEG